eukprot:TRINITY_DN6669_c0_g1_i1.p1 TRINITY_DN6669_c0_g1~~TRINITY_DN6669_c0_g1_i1.p1  ORF type:complete len:371 (-),score=52.59 TRINITY_DN6669_c0_g1_i1:1035-2036(-)
MEREKLSRNGYAEAVSLAQWALVEPSSLSSEERGAAPKDQVTLWKFPAQRCLLNRVRSSLIVQFRRMLKQPRAFLIQCHSLEPHIHRLHRIRVLLLYVFLELNDKSESREWVGVPGFEEMANPALTAAQQACQLARSCFDYAGNEPGLEREIPHYAFLFALALMRVDELPQTIEMLNLALARWRAQQPTPTMQVARVYGLLAGCYWLQRNDRKAQGFLEHAANLLQEEGEGGQRQLADVLDALGRVYAVQGGNEEDALIAFESSMKIRRTILGEEHRVLAFSFADRAKLFEDTKPTEAERLKKLARDLAGKSHGGADLEALRRELQSGQGKDK